MFYLKARLIMNYPSPPGESPAKRLLLKLYERNDTKRRRFLYLHYRPIFEKPYSVRYMVEAINRDLGKSVVNALDIKYIRANAFKWKLEETNLPSSKPQTS
jgi:hypothetical protein